MNQSITKLRKIVLRNSKVQNKLYLNSSSVVLGIASTIQQRYQ